ncbi:MAG: ParB N-terminal domain-containing protein [Minisyncoccales bacterium]
MKRNPLKEQPIPAGLGKILLAHLIPDAKNPRKDLKKGDPEFEKINKSVEKFGQLDPIIFNTRTRKILGGHQRLKVLDSQGYTELFTVALGAYTWAFAEADLKELSEKEENAANIALNKAQGDWDIEQLTINLQELKLDDMLEFTGFDDIEFDGMLRDLNNGNESLDIVPRSDFTPSYSPQFSAPNVTDADIQTSDRKLEQVTHKPSKTISAFCPKCGHEFEIGV